MKIALIEDNSDHSQLTQIWLEEGKHTCIAFDRGSTFLDAIDNIDIDLVIMDWNLPDIQGDEVLSMVRKKKGNNLPILFVTAHDNEEDIVKILQLGADDYMTKPVRFREMLARIDALERRFHDSKTQQNEKLIFAPYEFDIANRTIKLNNEDIATTQKEFELVLFMFRNSGRLLSRSKILKEVWDQDADLNTRTVDTHISRIRKKLQLNPENGWRINVVYQYGYRLEANELINPV